MTTVFQKILILFDIEIVKEFKNFKNFLRKIIR